MHQDFNSNAKVLVLFKIQEIFTEALMEALSHMKPPSTINF